MMKIHLHALYPPLPSRFASPAASKPPKAPASDVEAKKKLNLFCASERLYHIPAIRVISELGRPGMGRFLIHSIPIR